MREVLAPCAFVKMKQCQRGDEIQENLWWLDDA